MNLITFMLVLLKLGDVITWSWWLVFLPSIVWFAFVVLYATLITLINIYQYKE